MKKVYILIAIFMVVATSYYLMTPKQKRYKDSDFNIKEINDVSDLTPQDTGVPSPITVYYYAKNDMKCATPIAHTFDDIKVKPSFSEITTIHTLLTNPLPAGLQSAFIPGTQLNMFRISKGIAYLDLGVLYLLDVAPCGFIARKNQLEKTLSQFDSYKQLIVTVDGNRFDENGRIVKENNPIN